MSKLAALVVCLLFTAIPLQRQSIAKADASKRNVLFIAVDDLRPELGCYGHKIVKSPHIDRLAARGLVFDRAYCQLPLCGPTRTSLLTGLRPDSTRVFHNNTHFRDTVPDVVTLPQHFKNQGYATITMGKIFHPTLQDARSWTEQFQLPSDYPRYQTPEVGGYQLPENQALIRRKQQEARKAGLKGEALWGVVSGPPYECADVPDDAYQDGRIGEMGVEAIRKYKDRPFFIGVGFLKPHLNFVAPKRYWDLYDPNKIKLAGNPFPPKDCPPAALTPSIELRVREGVPKDGPIPDDLARRLLHGYYACVSYIDAQVGRLLDELDRQGLTKNTIVVLWGDHGWQLGEHALWGKAANFETGARAPLIVAAPGAKAAGKHSRALVEFVDIYPSLCQWAGLPLPGHLQGTNFLPLLDQPDRPWKSAAFTQYTCPALREWAGLPLSPSMQAMFGPLMREVTSRLEAADPAGYSYEKYSQHLMGYSMRTDRYRFVYWTDDRTPERAIALELYDHQSDPEENVNLADEPAQAELVSKLTAQFHAGWQAARPGK